jgi:hypothetical protein
VNCGRPTPLSTRVISSRKVVRSVHIRLRIFPRTQCTSLREHSDRFQNMVLFLVSLDSRIFLLCDHSDTTSVCSNYHLQAGQLELVSIGSFCSCSVSAKYPCVSYCRIEDMCDVHSLQRRCHSCQVSSLWSSENGHNLF